MNSNEKKYSKYAPTPSFFKHQQIFRVGVETKMNIPNLFKRKYGINN